MNQVTGFTIAKIDLENTGRAYFVDLKKVFGIIDHEYIFAKLGYYRFSGLIIELLASYLNNREQYISWNGTNSSKQKVITGVPQ